MRALALKGRGLLARRDTAAQAQRTAALALTIRVGNAGLAYLAQVVLARLMGQYEFGLFAYTFAWFMVFTSIATVGFGDSPLRYVALLRQAGEPAHLRGFVRFSALVIIIAGVSLGALLIAALPYMTHWIEEAYVFPLVLMTLCVPFASLQSFLEGLGRSYGWVLPAMLPIYILRHGLLLVVMVAAVAMGFEANAVNAFVCLLLVLVASLVYQATDILLRLRRVLEPAQPAYRAKEWLRGSAPFAVLYGSQHLSSFSDVLVLSFFVSPAEIAVYFAATRVIQVVNLVPYAATVGSAHLFAASHARGDRAELQQLCRNVCLTTFAVAILAVGLILLSGSWLLAMFGQGFEAGYAPLAILSVAVVARVTTGPAEDILNMTGHSSLSASSYLVIIAVNVVLGIALIVPFGINGAAAATAATLSFRAVWLLVAARRRLGIDTSVISALRTLPRGRHPALLQQPAE